MVTASLVVVDPHGTLAANYEWLVDPGVEIPEEAAAVHGVTTERARAEGLPADLAIVEIADTLRDFFDAGIPGHRLPAAATITSWTELRRGLDPRRTD